MKRDLLLLILATVFSINVSGQGSQSLGVILPDNCNNAVPLGDYLSFDGTMFVEESCEESEMSNFYFGFYAQDNMVFSFDVHLIVSKANIYYDQTNIYGPFESNSDACTSFELTTPVETEIHQEILGPTVSSSYSYDLAGPTTDAYYLMEIGACLYEDPDQVGHGVIRISIENTKDTLCNLPCNVGIPPCENPPCDGITICDLFPLQCDSCDLYPALCDSCDVNPALCDTTEAPQPPCDNIITSEAALDCPTCIGRFAPTPGESYVFGAWVREEDATALFTTYDDPKIKLRFYDGMDNSIGNVALGTSGPIVEGWQQISEEVKIPESAVRMEMELYVQNGNAFFDDIRVSPFNSALKTYVFDQKNMRMVAEMDERNYATFYQYDEEGRKVAVKKETERGIKTILVIQQNTSTNNAE